MVRAAPGPVGVMAPHTDRPRRGKLRFAPSLAQAEETRVDQETYRQIGKVLNKILESHPI